MIDKDFTINTLQKLVQINSVNPDLEDSGGGEQEIGQYIFNLLDQLGIEVEMDELAPGRLNVTGYLRGSGGGRSLMLNAHMDTVGVNGMEDPFSADIQNGKLYGRGAYDMKGGIASILAAAKAIKEVKQELKGDLILSFVADEEYESIGAQALMKKLKTDAAIVTEPTDLNICLAHRGFGIYTLTSTGKTAHGGNHKLGTDANMKMGQMISELSSYSKNLPEEKRHPLCGEASMHVPLVRGGRSLFIYSNECSAHLERRTLPGETETSVRTELQEVIKKAIQQDPEIQAELDLKIWRAPYEIDRDARIVQHVDKAVTTVREQTPEYIGHSWWEDSAIFGEAGIESVILGPKGGGIHEEVEWVEIDSVVELAEILVQTSLGYG